MTIIPGAAPKGLPAAAIVDIKDPANTAINTKIAMKTNPTIARKLAHLAVSAKCPLAIELICIPGLLTWLSITSILIRSFV